MMETAEDKITGNNVCGCAFDVEPQILQEGKIRLIICKGTVDERIMKALETKEVTRMR